MALTPTITFQTRSTCSWRCYILRFAAPAVAPVAVLQFRPHVPLYLSLIEYYNQEVYCPGKSCLLSRRRPVVPFYCNEQKLVYRILWSCFKVLSYLLTCCTYQRVCRALRIHEFRSTEDCKRCSFQRNNFTTFQCSYTHVSVDWLE